MSSSKIEITETTMKTKDLQKQIMKTMLRKNPDATMAQMANSYEALKNFILGGQNNDNRN